MIGVATQRYTEQQWPDVVSSTEQYAKRFSGSIGKFFLDTQSSEVIRRVTDFDAKTVLDVGGGHCQLARPLVDFGAKVTVLGSTNDCAQQLRLQFGNEEYTFVSSDLYPLPFDDRSFDVVTSFRTMSHLPDWPRAIAELCRVANSAVIVDFAAKSWGSRFSGAVLSAKHLVERDARPYLTQAVAEVADTFASNGFRVEHIFRQFAIPMAIHRLLRMRDVSEVAENILRSVGVTRLCGSPVIMTAVPINRVERGDRS